MRKIFSTANLERQEGANQNSTHFCVLNIQIIFFSPFFNSHNDQLCIQHNVYTPISSVQIKFFEIHDNPQRASFNLLQNAVLYEIRSTQHGIEVDVIRFDFCF